VLQGSWKVKGETLMEYETTERETKSPKGTLTKIVKFSAAFCAFFAAAWVTAASFHQHANSLAGLAGLGLMVGLLVTIAALNVRLRVELEEPDSAD
jgi:hypothetical protein